MGPGAYLARQTNSAERAATGAALMDAKYPGWEFKIDAATLKIASCTKCVLGQVYGSYSEGLRQVGLETTEASTYGFSWIGGDLDEAWREEVAKRRVRTLVPA